MSASIYWRVVKPPEGVLDVWASSSFISTMQRAFGESYPWVLTYNDIPKLEGMASVLVDDKRNPYKEIIDKIRLEDGSVCSIEVWPEY